MDNDNQTSGASSSPGHSPLMIMPSPAVVSGTNDTAIVSGTDDTTAVSGTDDTTAVSGTDDTTAVSGTDDTTAAATTGIADPSNVRNLRDILKYTTQMTGATTDEYKPDSTITDEKKKFLSNVLSTMSVNVHEEMNNSINILLDSNKYVEEHEYAFDVITEYIENIDYANDFQKLGGFQVFTPCLKSHHKSVRAKTAELIAMLVQQNPYCQDKFIEHQNYIRLLISLVERDLEDEVRVKALHAISCLVRNNISVFWKFIDLGGDNLIFYALKSSSEKLKVKATFLIYSTCHMGNDIAELYVANGVVEIICSVILTMEKSLPVYHHELFLSTLTQLLRMSPTKVKEKCSSVEDFNLALSSLRDSYPNETNFQDEKDQILWLMETLTL